MRKSAVTHHGYGLRRDTDLSYTEAVERIRATLKEQGFGILTEIDVASTLAAKLGVTMTPYIMLGACNPALAHQALSAERDIGLLLPCNVIVYEGDAPDRSVVAVMDPVAALALTGREDIQPIALEVRRRLEAALAAIEAPA